MRATTLAGLVERRELAEGDRLDERGSRSRWPPPGRRGRGDRRRWRSTGRETRSARRRRRCAPRRRLAGRVRGADRRPRVLECEALEDAARRRAPASSAGAGRSLAQNSRIRRGMSPGVAKPRVVRVDERSRAAARRAPTRRAVEGVVVSVGAQARRHSCRSQSPVTLRRSRMVPADAALVGQVRGKRRVVDQRPVELEPDKRPGAGADVDRARARAKGTAATAEPVSCVAARSRRGRASRAPRPRSGASGPSTVPGRDDLGQQVGGNLRGARAGRRAHVPSWASKNCVVVAFVHSLTGRPPSQ